MRWFRNLTGSTYDREPIAEAWGGASATGADAAEAGWLARGYRAVKDFTKRHYRVALGAAAGVGAMVAAERGADASPIVDIDWRLAGDNSNIHYLDDKTTLDPLMSTPTYDVINQTRGTVKFEDGSGVPSNWQLWVFDKVDEAGGKQICGVYRIPAGDEGWHDFTERGQGIYGDLPDGLDKGAEIGHELGVIGQNTSTNEFFLGSWSHTLYFSGDEELRDGFDITIIPEPATLALLGAGVGIAALTRRRRKFQPEMGSDIGKPETPYYRRTE